MRVLVAVLCLFGISGQAVPQETRGLQPADFYQEITPSQAAVSPDGRLLAFTVTSVDEEENKRHREVWMQRLSNGKPDGEPYAFTAPTEESSSPVWSPDNKLLAVQSKRTEDEDDTTTWFLRTTSPGGEAFQIEGVEGSPVWSPDGKWIAFTKEPEDEPEEGTEENPEESVEKKKKDEREGWISPDAITKTLDAKRFDGRVLTQMSYKSDGTLTLLPHRSAKEKTQLYVVPSESGEAVQLTTLTFDVEAPVWSANSRYLYFAGDEMEDDEYTTDLTSDIYVVGREGGDPRKLTTNPGSEYAPAVSPDGRRLAYLHSPERGAQTDVFVVVLATDGSFGSEPRNLTADWDLSPGAPNWAGNNGSVRFGAGITGNAHLFEVSVNGGRVKQVTAGERNLGGFSFSESGNVMAYTATTPLVPEEVFVARGSGSGETRLTRLNDDWLAEIALNPAERLTWKVDDGTEVEGWLIKPLGFDPANSYPMILKIHGGPHAAYGNYWFRTFHILSAAGFFVLYTNPRGSSGYGHDFMYATRGKWGIMDSEDYLTGVDAALAAYPQIDEKRLGVSGGSYGGFMTAWLSATTDRFAAANPSRMIANWESWYGASDAQRLTEWEFFATPWDERDLYRQLSPLTYVENVTAPTLIIHSENDYRTPIADGEQWYMALKKRGVPVEMVRYPRSTHDLSRTGEPWLLVDRLERIRSWFVHWLIDAPAAGE